MRPPLRLQTHAQIGGATNCPCCRAPFENAPGFVAMAAAQERTDARPPAFMPTAFLFGGDLIVLPEVPLPAGAIRANTTEGRVGPDFASATVVTDYHSIAGEGATTRVTALVRIKYVFRTRPRCLR